MLSYRQRVQQAMKQYAMAIDAQGRCVESGILSCTGRAPSPLYLAEPGVQPDGGPVTPALSPQEAAYVATARLRLTAPTPGIGPSPDLNRWKIAAVGYPLWLWADGTLNPAPVSDSVAGLAVSLNAHLVKVVFDMGDGHKVTCTDLTRRWTNFVTPGAPSAVCGYAYPKPSLPQGSYTVTANAVWAIDWQINGTTGTIPFYQSATTTIPVGELQVLTR